MLFDISQKRTIHGQCYQSARKEYKENSVNTLSDSVMKDARA